MTLMLFIGVPLVGGLLAWQAGRYGARWARLTAIVATGTQALMAIGIWLDHWPDPGTQVASGWWLEERYTWSMELGITCHLGLDGLSILMLLLTAVMGLFSVLISWREIQDRVGLYHACLLWVLAGICGVFLSLDLIVFYVFWEIMLVPMVFLIGIWGHEKKVFAAIKFFLFTQASSLLMLLAILGLYFLHAQETGTYTFSYLELLGTEMSFWQGMLLMLGFFIAFAVKLPVVPFHSWLADAHSQAPTAGSLILAGLLLKTGAYGLMRFAVPLFPDPISVFAPVAMVLAVLGILYGAVLAFSQTDLKRMVAYTSVSHMGFVLLGVFADNQLSRQGAIMQMICHALSTGALFVLAGMLAERLHTRNIDRMGGFWAVAPRMGGLAMFFALAALGMPGLGNFVAEFLVLFGSFYVNVWVTVLATIGLVFASVYALWMVQKIFHGQFVSNRVKMTDAGVRETTTLAIMAAFILWLGLYPYHVLETAKATVVHPQAKVFDPGGDR